MISRLLIVSLLPAISVVYRILSPLVADFVPLNYKVIHVRNSSSPEAPDSFGLHYPVLDFIGLVEQHGYTAEEYNVTTDDGYILRLHRISGSPSIPKSSGKPVIYLQHGIFLSSDSWVLIGPGKDLAFLLVDAGYDVWMGNVRGNTYSRARVSRNSNEDYWKFSYHELAVHDLRSFIDRTLSETGAKDLKYFGYSMGTTLSYALLSTHPEYNSKISQVYSAAPVVFWESELRRLMKFANLVFDNLKIILEYFHIHELLPQTAVAAFMGTNLCSDDNAITQPLCVHIFSNIGLDPNRLNKTALPQIMAHFPAGASYITMYHYNQNYKRVSSYMTAYSVRVSEITCETLVKVYVQFSDSFSAYDYDPVVNAERYNQVTPPVYDLSKVTVPVTIWYAKDDSIVNPQDVFHLSRLLPNVTSVNAVDHEKFNHFDFLWALDARELFYDRLLQQIL